MAQKKPNKGKKIAKIDEAPTPLERGVAPRQWQLPAGYSVHDGKMVSLEDVLSTQSVTKQLSDLSADELAELTAARISNQKQYKIAMVGLGVIGKARAISEIKSRSAAGMALIEIERRTIERVVAAARQAAQGSAAPPAGGGENPR